MHVGKWLLSLMTVFTLTLSTAAATESDAALGERLLREVWQAMKTSDMQTLENTLAPGFQSVHQYGASDRGDELALIRDLELGDYTLSDIRVTRNGPVIVATYAVTVAETLQGKRLERRPAPRMSVFVKTEQGWQWMAHANLNPVQN